MVDADVARVRLLAAALVVWTTAGGAGLLAYDRDQSRWVAAGLVALIAAAALAQPIPRAGYVAAGLAALGYGGLQLARSIAGFGALPQLFAALFVFAMTAVLAEALAGELARLSTRIVRDRQVIDELSPRDETTGTLRRRHAERRLTEEIDRARRYHRPLTLVLVRPREWDEVVATREPSDLRRVLGELGDALTELVRSVDAVGFDGEGTFWLILPETSLTGAEALAAKAVEVLEARLGEEALAGIAEFPIDAATPEELIREADAALSFALEQRLRVVGRGLLQ